jgi:hypothetical protein
MLTATVIQGTFIYVYEKRNIGDDYGREKKRKEKKRKEKKRKEKKRKEKKRKEKKRGEKKLSWAKRS